MQPLEPLLMERRRQALEALLVFTLPAASAFIAIDLYFGTKVLAVLAATLLIGSAVALLAMRRGVQVGILAPIYLAGLFSNLIVVQAHELHAGAAVWVPVIPVLCYMLLDVRHAPAACAVSLIAAFGADIFGRSPTLGMEGLLPSAHLLTASVGLFIFIDYYTRNRHRDDQGLLERVHRDPLTGLMNREALSLIFQRERRTARRTQIPLSVLLVDLDHFKKINDRHGHDAGDAALRFFADFLRTRLRKTDLSFRIGGEEFIILLPATDLSGAGSVGEALRKALEESPFEYNATNIKLTLSGGAVELGRSGTNWLQLYRAADTLLYESKAAGRNRITIRNPRDFPAAQNAI